MIVAIASGKGGTGKTTVAVGLAHAYRALRRSVQLIDCDVEEPNVHLLLRPEIRERAPVRVAVPVVDPAACNQCGRCARVCEFGAIACLKDEVLVFPELCHACGACVVLCPQEALREVPRDVGQIELGAADGIAYAGGRLNVGEPRAVPVIAELKRRIARDAVVLLDAPPGTSCPVMTVLKGSDFILFVAEPTPFGLHDLRLAIEGAAELDVPWGLVVNRAGMGDESVQAFAAQRGIPLLAELPDDQQVATAQSRGESAYEASATLAALFDGLAGKLEQQVATCAS